MPDLATDLLISGGRVFRGLSGGFAEAILVRSGRVAAVGSLADVQDAAPARTRRLDLGGRVAIPAFNEAHMHLLPYGLGLRQINLRPDDGVRTLDQVLSRVAAAAATMPPGEWVVGRGYDHLVLDVGRHPTAEELQRAAPDNPIYIVRTCGHMGAASTAALSLAGIGHNTPNPQGGAIERKNGKLTGLLQERAQRLLSDHIPKPGEARMVDAIEAAGRDLASRGFASASDMMVGTVDGLTDVAAYRRALQDGRLVQRMWQVLAGNPEGIATAAWESGMRPDHTHEMLAWGAVKTFADGSAGGLTAAFFDPYEADQGGGHGMLCFPDDVQHEMLARYHRQGWQLDIHAIGDAAIEQVLAGMEAADTPDMPVQGRRHRIEHCGFLNAGQRRRMKARGILPVPQPAFMYEFGDVYLKVLGQARSAAAYPMRSWLDEGHNPSASSDCPVCAVNPFSNLYTMTTRRTVNGTVIGPDQCLSMEEAVHCYTWCGAYSQFAESSRGTLEPGQLADIAVLSTDIFAQEAESVREAQADLTLRGGLVLFDRHGELATVEAAL